MKKEENNDVKENGHRTGHLRLMIICCGLPLLALIVVSAVGLDASSIEILLLIACPALMITMMSMMNRKHGQREQNSCCQSLADDKRLERNVDSKN